MSLSKHRCHGEIVPLDELLEFSVDVNSVIEPARDPDGKARVEIVLECPECRSKWFAFVAVKDFENAP